MSPLPPVRRTHAGRAPRSSAHWRISSWSVVIFDPPRLLPRLDVLRTLPRVCEPPRADPDRRAPPRADADLVLAFRAVFRAADEREPAALLRVFAPARLRAPLALEARELEPDRLRDDAVVRERDPELPRVEADRA